MSTSAGSIWMGLSVHVKRGVCALEQDIKRVSVMLTHYADKYVEANIAWKRQMQTHVCTKCFQACTSFLSDVFSFYGLIMKTKSEQSSKTSLTLAVLRYCSLHASGFRRV